MNSAFPDPSGATSLEEMPVQSQSTHARRRQRRRFRTNLLILCVVLLGAIGALIYTALPRRVGKPFTVPFAAGEPAFQDSMSAVIGAPFVGGNSFTTLVNGKEIFPAMLEAIRSAKTSVTLETYIWSSGKLSDQFIEALRDRAQHGVKVHALVDGIGAIHLSHAEMDQMKDAGVEFVLYQREHWYQPKPDLNHRTHRKILVVDGRIGFTGGVCIADEWLGDADSDKVWRDTQVRIEGPAVAQMQAAFAVNWLQTTARLLVGTDYFPHMDPAGNVRVQAVKSGPIEAPENARISHLIAIAAARKSIRLSHAYFVPDDLAVDMLIAARKRGVDIEVIVPAKNDSKVGRAASRARWGKLLAAGVKFYCYQPALYHQKSMIVDDVFVTVGSVNFDNRSFTINDEFNLNVVDAAVAHEQLALFKKDRSASTAYTLEEYRDRGWWVKLWDDLCSLLRVEL